MFIFSLRKIYHAHIKKIKMNYGHIILIFFFHLYSEEKIKKLNIKIHVITIHVKINS